MAYIGSPAAPTIATVSDDTITSAKIDSTSTGMTFADLTVDTNTLVVDETNNRVGVGTTTPSALLHLSSGGSNMFQLTSSHITKTWMEASAGNGDMWRLGTVDSNPDVRLEALYSTGDIKFITNSTEHMRIDNAGIVTKANQPAFLAQVDPTGGDQTLALLTENTIEMGNELYDQNSDYNPATYTFTAPVTGKYVLIAAVRVDSVDTATAFYRLRIYTSNRVYYQILDPNFSSDLSYLTFNMSVVADMDAGDTSLVSMYQSSGTASHLDDGNAYSWFSGYLLG